MKYTSTMPTSILQYSKSRCFRRSQDPDPDKIEKRDTDPEIITSIENAASHSGPDVTTLNLSVLLT